MSGADYFDDGFAINSLMDEAVPVNLSRAKAEHTIIKALFEQAGIEVIKIDPPKDCQDGVYTANWALVIGHKAVMSNLPNTRTAEEPYATQKLQELSIEIVKMPSDLHFSGQGDALPCGDYIFAGTGYRTSPEVHAVLEKEFGKKVIGVRAIPEKDNSDNDVINPVTGWPDSYFYDLDLAIAVINPGLIAWCPEALTEESQAKIRDLTDLDKIEVSFKEAKEGFACNLVSTGETVVMSKDAPNLKAELEKRGLKVLSPNVTELQKGGGFIRCVSLTI